MIRGRHNVRISGATGTSAGLINGLYKPTHEMCNNVTVYQKVTDCNVWLEYSINPNKSWRVKNTDEKGISGSSASWAYCSVSEKGFPQECPVGKWEVYVDTKWVTQSTVKIQRVTNS